MNIFSLHGKWYDDNENRLTSNVLFFLDNFKKELLKPLLTQFFPVVQLPSNLDKDCKLKFQVYDNGKIPDAEVIIYNRKTMVNTRILIESKIRSNSISYNQMEEYSKRLKKSSGNYSEYYLLVITQTDQKNRILQFAQDIENKGIIAAGKILGYQWRDVLSVFNSVMQTTGNKPLKYLLNMFLEEVEITMYNRIDISELQLKELHDIVLTTQNKTFFDMALEDGVFWPKDNFTPAQYVAYYFTNDCQKYQKTISHIARIKHIWHNVTIDEVLTSIPEFQMLPNFERFRQRALNIYGCGDPTLFAIAIADEAIPLINPIKYDSSQANKLNPNIIPGRHVTMSKLLQARILEDLV